MRKLIFILSFVAVMANASALSQITASGSRPKAGDVIHGVVKDSEGLAMVGQMLKIKSPEY